MAASGTGVGSFNTQGAWKVVLSAILQTSQSQSFTLKEYTSSTFVVSGTWGTATGLQPQGSNDDGVTWVNIGSGITPTGPQAGTLTPGAQPYGLYRFDLAGGNGSTSLNINIRAVIPR